MTGMLALHVTIEDFDPIRSDKIMLRDEEKQTEKQRPRQGSVGRI